MKIAFDAKRALNNSTGLGNYARVLINALMRDFPDHDYLLFSPKIEDALFHQLHGQFKMILPEGKLNQAFKSYWRSFSSTAQIENERVDIYHGLSNELPFNIHKSHVKTVVTIHDLIFLKHHEQFPFVDRQIYKAKTQYACKHAHAIIAVSEETKADLVQFYRVDPARIHVVYQSTDSSFTSFVPDQADETVRSRYELPETYILNVSSFYPRKNHEALLRAFALVQNDIRENLVLVGNTGDSERVKQLIAELHLDKRVQVILNASNQDLPSIYYYSNLFVYPSLFEGFGLPIVEAMWAETPVITSKRSAMMEAGGNAAIYVDPSNPEELASAMLGVLSNEMLRKDMMVSGTWQAATMTDKDFAAKTMEVYKQL